MERKEVFKALNEIFRDVLDNVEIELTDTTSANDIDEWDSLSHVQLFDAIQKFFHVKITAREMVSWKNVGEMVDSIIEKLK